MEDEAQDDNKESITKQLIEGLLSRSLQHHFAVAVDTEEHATKRICTLAGPTLLIEDETRCLPPVNIYLPNWYISPKKTKNHRTLIFTPRITLETQQIKMKTKNQKTSDTWFRMMDSNIEDMQFLKIRYATYHIRLNKDGAFVKSTLTIANDSIKFVSHNRILVELPRFPEINAIPNINEPLKVQIFRNNHMVNSVQCVDALQARKVLLALNSLPDELETVPQVVLQMTDVPEINDEDLFDGGISSVMLDENESDEEEEAKEQPDLTIKPSEMSSLVPSGETVIDNIDTNSEPPKLVDGSPEAPKTTKKTKKRKRGKGILDTGPVDFESKMKEKHQKFLEMPRLEPIPEKDVLIAGFMKDFLDSNPAKPGSFPVIEVQGTDEEAEPKFIFKKLPFTENLFRNEVQNQLNPNEVTIATTFNIAELFNSLTESQQARLKSLSIVFNQNDYTQKNVILKALKDAPKEMLPIYASGVFLHCRGKSYKALYQDLNQLKFSIKQISRFIEQNPFKSEESCVNFFIKLFSVGYARMFFITLDTMKKFRNSSYFYDSCMRVDGFCSEIAGIFDCAVNNVPKFVPPLPILEYNAPHIVLSNIVPFFKQNQTQNWIDSDGPSKSAYSPFSLIIAAIVELLAYGNTSILYDGKIGLLLDNFKKMTNRMTMEMSRALQNVQNTQKKAPDTQIVSTYIIVLLITGILDDFLIGYCEAYRGNNELMNEFVLCTVEINKLKGCFVKGCAKTDRFYDEVHEDLLKIFTRNK